MLHLECNRHKVSKDLNPFTDGDGMVKSDVFFVWSSWVGGIDELCTVLCCKVLALFYVRHPKCVLGFITEHWVS